MTSPSAPLPPPSFQPHRPEDGDDLVTALTCASDFEAQTKAAVLHDAGIQAFAFGGAQAALPLGTAKFLRVPVQVRAADLERARRVLEENASRAAGVDWDNVEVGEREDGLPLRRPGRMPFPARIGFILAMILLATMLAGLAWSAAMAILGRW